jgi:hypothetical protein
LASVSFLRGLASLRFAELATGKLDLATKKSLHQQFQARCLEFRHYTGTDGEKPAMGQTTLFSVNNDNPAAE